MIPAVPSTRTGNRRTEGNNSATLTPLPAALRSSLLLLPEDNGCRVECLNCPASLVVRGVSHDKLKRMMRAWDGEHECSGKF